MVASRTRKRSCLGGTGILACGSDRERQECLCHRSVQLADRITVLDDRLRHLARQIGAKPKLRHIEQEVNDGGKKVRRRGTVPWMADVPGRPSGRSPCRFSGRRRRSPGSGRPVVAAAVAIFVRPISPVSTNSTCLRARVPQVLDERRDGVIDLAAEHFHRVMPLASRRRASPSRSRTRSRNPTPFSTSRHGPSSICLPSRFVVRFMFRHYVSSLPC